MRGFEKSEEENTDSWLSRAETTVDRVMFNIKSLSVKETVYSAGLTLRVGHDGISSLEARSNVYGLNPNIVFNNLLFRTLGSENPEIIERGVEFPEWEAKNIPNSSIARTRAIEAVEGAKVYLDVDSDSFREKTQQSELLLKKRLETSVKHFENIYETGRIGNEVFFDDLEDVLQILELSGNKELYAQVLEKYYDLIIYYSSIIGMDVSRAVERSKVSDDGDCPVSTIGILQRIAIQYRHRKPGVSALAVRLLYDDQDRLNDFDEIENIRTKER
jgi:hypothetical protein